MEVKIALPYGEGYITAALPEANLAAVVEGRTAPPLADEKAALATALQAPIGCPPLLERIGEDDRVIVITTDNTRHCPDDRILPPLLEELEKKVPRENITIMVALGLHPPLDRDELACKLGEAVVADYRVVNHDPEQVVSLGTTGDGASVEVNRAVAEADFRISTGFIEPHFFAGFSGGRKSILPGVSSAASIRRNHRFEMVEHPLTRTGVLRGNPIHEDMVAHARIARLDFIVNVLLDKERRITGVFAGDMVAAHEAACAAARDLVQVEVDRRVDITVVTNSGAPLDLDFYQTCKGIDTASQITRDGGIIIAVSCCPVGIGPESFRELHAAARSPQEVMEVVRTTENTGVNWQNQILARSQMKQTIFLLSSLDESVGQMMVTPIQSLEEGLERAFRELGSDASIAVIPEGPLVLPVVRD